MSYHDNKPVRTATAVRMQDDKKKIDRALKEMDPAKYGEDVAERIADKATERITDYGESGRADNDSAEEQKEEVKKIIRQTVQEEM